MITLERCPHCEGIGTLWSVDQCNTVYAVCLSCGCRTGDFKTAEEAAEVWNKRVVRMVSVERIIRGLHR